MPASECNCDDRAKASGYHLICCPEYEQWADEFVRSVGKFHVSRHEPTIEASPPCVCDHGLSHHEYDRDRTGNHGVCKAEGCDCMGATIDLQDDYVEQDTANCHICGDPLLTIPRLGDWIMHPRCQQEVRVRIDEAEQRATRIERARIDDILDRHIGKWQMTKPPHGEVVFDALVDVLDEINGEFEEAGT